MINRILERLGKERVNSNVPTDVDFWSYLRAVSKCEEIVQEVAKDGGKDTNVRSNGWIPVETELPKDSRDVWVTIKTKSGDYYVSDSFYDLNLGKWRVGKLAEVIAWQPKQIPPAPYQKGDN